VVRGHQEGDLFVRRGQRVLVVDATINGNILITPGSPGGRATQVSIVDSRVNGNVTAGPQDGTVPGAAVVCLRADRAGATFVNGGVDVADSVPGSAIRVSGPVEVGGGVELDESVEVRGCGGKLTIEGGTAGKPVLRSDVQAVGACSVTVAGARISGDVEAGDVSGVFAYSNNVTTSDVQVDGAREVRFVNNRSSGGDVEFSGVGKLTVTGNGRSDAPYTGGVGVSGSGTVLVAGNRFKGGLEADSNVEVTIRGNRFAEGGVRVDGGNLVTRKAVVEKNTVGSGNLSVSEVADVRVTDNLVSNGNLEIVVFNTCVAFGNRTPKGNVVAAGCRAGTPAP
jgi:hypothetical protein